MCPAGNRVDPPGKSNSRDVAFDRRAVERYLDRLLPIFSDWGVAGIKFGFVQVGNQEWMEWTHRMVELCAEYRMVVDIHDEYEPTGMNRMLPNLLTQEGILGNEAMPDARHNATLPFTRFLMGAGDYTPCFYSPKVKNSRAHQLALPILYFSPLQFLFWYDRPSDYRGEPGLQLWKDVPTVWDETRVLQGEIGIVVTIPTGT